MLFQSMYTRKYISLGDHSLFELHASSFNVIKPKCVARFRFHVRTYFPVTQESSYVSALVFSILCPDFNAVYILKKS